MKLMQQLALENNLSETAFFVPSKKKNADFDIRWFTPGWKLIFADMPHSHLPILFLIY